MNYLLLIAGILILLTIVYDIAYTTFSPNGAGFFTDTITKGFYNLSRNISLKIKFKKLFEHVGILIIGVVLAFWYLSVWIGSSLIICSDPNSIINSTTKLPADVYEKIYYTGFTLSTLGVGDFQANSDAWRIFTVFLSLSGFVLITTSISYMVPVLSATVSKRKLGSYIAMLGANPQDILLKQWQKQKESFGMLETHFTNLTEMIIQHSQQMLAYPVVYCFDTTNPKKATALNIGKLDEVLTILLLYIPSDHRPSDQSIYPLREAITDYIDIQKNYFIKLIPVEPHLPDLSRLQDAGIPLLTYHDKINKQYDELSDRRKLMGAILKNQGRDFGDIYYESKEYGLKLK